MILVLHVVSHTVSLLMWTLYKRKGCVSLAGTFDLFALNSASKNKFVIEHRGKEAMQMSSNKNCACVQHLGAEPAAGGPCLCCWHIRSAPEAASQTPFTRKQGFLDISELNMFTEDSSVLASVPGAWGFCEPEPCQERNNRVPCWRSQHCARRLLLTCAAYVPAHVLIIGDVTTLWFLLLKNTPVIFAFNFKKLFASI